MVKQLHTNLNWFIVLDLCQLHYLNLLVTHNSIECNSRIEKIKINTECCFVGLKINKLIYKCKECKEEWKRPLNKLTESFPSIYQLGNGNLNKFVMLLRKRIYPYEYNG